MRNESRATGVSVPRNINEECEQANGGYLRLAAQNPDFRRSWGDCVARARGLAGGAWGMGEDFVQGVEIVEDGESGEPRIDANGRE
jgi:hypothetical protein